MTLQHLQAVEKARGRFMKFIAKDLGALKPAIAILRLWEIRLCRSLWTQSFFKCGLGRFVGVSG
jgi:hypothetical protein